MTYAGGWTSVVLPRLAPNPVHADLQAAAPPKKPVAKKKELVAAAARPAATASVASAAPKPAPTSAPALTSAPSALTEMAPSATTRHSARRTGIGNTYGSAAGPALCALAGVRWHTRLAGCRHKSSCASTTPRTVCKPQRKPKIPWRARCFSGMRWSGCGTGLQHPSTRSSVPYVDARQHRDQAWYIEPSTSLRCDGRQPNGRV